MSGKTNEHAAPDEYVNCCDCIFWTETEGSPNWGGVCREGPGVPQGFAGPAVPLSKPGNEWCGRGKKRPS